MRNPRRARLVLTMLLLTAFTLITLDYRSGGLGGVRSAASSVFGPIEDGIDAIVHPIGSWFSGLGHLGSYKHENQDLRRKVARLQTQIRMNATEHQEYLEEQKLLHLAGLGQFTSVAARVIAYGGAFGFESTITINRGTANGIGRNESVITGAGLVGRVVAVSRNTATVQLADDSQFTAGARLSTGTLAVGAVQGEGRGELMSLTLLDNTVRLRTGQQLVTFASSQNGPFVPEVPIGTITRVTPANGQIAQTALVKPFVSFGSLDIVAVVVHAPKTIQHDLLLPKSPTPAPTVTVTVTATPGAPTSPGTTPTSSITPGTTPTGSSSANSGRSPTR
ncbi:MAG TPA: rod shape-determining protein MreC [Mycobacteriales bacterium]|jgi:rod shape-determining protein MreC|nr:rod shape-determining protein MreC [Mycobacteriales bacterium]